MAQFKRPSISSQQNKKPLTATSMKCQTQMEGFSRAHHLTIGLLAVANFFTTVTFASILPFFPIVATQEKELSTVQVGFAIGIFKLVIFLASPVIGKKMGFLGPYRAFSGGILLSGISTIAFAFAIFLPAGTPFFVGICLIRCCQALGKAALGTGCWAIVGRMFPDRISTITSINEVAYGIGFSVGPPLGSALYELGGYMLPLVVVGCLQLLVFLLSLPLNWAAFEDDAAVKSSTQMSDDEEEQNGPTPGIFQLLFIPDVFMAMLSLFVYCMAFTFYEPALATHLSTFPSNWSASALVGLMMSVLSISYLAFAPIWGFFMDRHLFAKTTSVMLIGGLFIAASDLLMGPAPFLGLKKSLVGIGISYVLMGFAGAILYIPVFKWCIDAAKRRGFDEKSPTVCGLISGLFQSIVSLGAFLGTFLGGLSAQTIGFQWTAACMAGIELIQICIQVIYGLAKRMRKENWTTERRSHKI